MNMERKDSDNRLRNQQHKNDEMNGEFAHLFQEKVEIPESLLPENMEMRLRKLEQAGELKKRMNSQKYIPYAAVAAMLVIVAGFGIFAVNWGMNHGTKDSVSKEYGQESAATDFMGEETKTLIAEEELAKANYKAAYNTLEEYQKAYNNNYYAHGENSIFDVAKNKISDFFGITRESEGYSAKGIEDTDMAVNEAPSMVEESADEDVAADYSRTNVRTQNVEETDIVKTDGKYIYEYDCSTEYINIYKAEGETTTKAGEINLNPYDMTVNEQGFYIQNGVLVVVGDTYKETSYDKEESIREYTEEELQKVAETDMSDYKEGWYDEDSEYAYECYSRTLLFDVGNPEKPQLLHGFFQDGSYDSSRLVDGVLYLFSTRQMNVERLDQEDSSTYIPKIQGKIIAGKNITVQKNYVDCRYTIISSISLTDCIYIDQKAVLGGNGNMYVSGKNIYLLDTDYYAEGKANLMRISYKDGRMKKEAQGRIKGYINDDYSMDEYQDYLRVVSTYYNQDGERVNGLFVLDEDLKQVGCLKNLAEGEEIYSARFLGDTAYFVTYRNMDPLFAVDVSNPEKPKMLSYLKIPGFSSYLHPYNDHLLLGIGLETDENSNTLGVKLSMFDISKPEDVKEVDKVVLQEYDNTEVLYNPNALLIDTQKNLIGMQMKNDDSDWDETENGKNDYLIYSYNEKKGFVQNLKYSLKGKESNLKKKSGGSEEEILGDYYPSDIKGRGLYINDTLYVVAVGQKITTFDLTTFDKMKVNQTKEQD